MAGTERLSGNRSVPASRYNLAVRQATTIVSVDNRPIAVRVRELALEVLSGPDAGVVVTLRGRALSIGAAPGNDLRLADPAVSRFHCRVVAGDDGYRVVDRRSVNGTFVDGTRVRDGYLREGARLRVGETEIAIRDGGGEAEIELAPEERFGAAPTAAPVLLLGETGTGKDLLARAIHDHSGRPGPFVVFDCGAVAPTLIESALFGHVRGAFTGADADRPGVFEQARGGTLFLDEIGELPPSLQPKLLRALEAGTVTRVGGVGEVGVDARVIAATHRDLRRAVNEEAFRADLFYRLAVIVLEVPPLRERPEDIPLLCAHFLRELLDDGAGGAWLRPHLEDAFGALAAHRWPGNIRELRNVLERAAALADPRELSKDRLARLVELRSSIVRTMHTRPPLKAAREQFDREYLRDVLAAAHGDVQRAAEVAQVHPKSFERLLRRYRVPRP